MLKKEKADARVGGDMVKKLVMEGDLKDTGGDLLLHTNPAKDGCALVYTPETLLEKFVGMKIRVMIEEIEEEDCPPLTGPDGKRAADKKDW